MFVDKDGESDSMVVIILLSVIAAILFIAGVILLILYIKQRAVTKRSYIVFVFYVVIVIMDVCFTVFGEIISSNINFSLVFASNQRHTIVSSVRITPLFPAKSL